MATSHRLKRLLDVAIALVGFLLSLPLQVLIATAIIVSDGRPVLFTQDRVGRGDKPFCLIKFRTMSEQTDHAGVPLPDADRVTALGRVLRRYSLDELPELWNVLRGDMALVGPRPLPVRYLPRYTVIEARRHEVRPGLTGLAQVSGRNLLGWDDRLAMDVWYVDHRSTRLDLHILGRTVGVVLSGSEAAVQTMRELRPEWADTSAGKVGDTAGPSLGVSTK